MGSNYWQVLCNCFELFKLLMSFTKMFNPIRVPKKQCSTCLTAYNNQLNKTLPDLHLIIVLNKTVQSFSGTHWTFNFTVSHARSNVISFCRNVITGTFFWWACVVNFSYYSYCYPFPRYLMSRFPWILIVHLKYWRKPECSLVGCCLSLKRQICSDMYLSRQLFSVCVIKHVPFPQTT